MPKLLRWPAFIKSGKLFNQRAMVDLKEKGQCYGLGLVWCELAVAARHRARHDHAEVAGRAREYTPSEMLVLLARKLHARKAKCLSQTFSSFAGFKYKFTSKSKALNRLHRRIRAYQASQRVTKPDEYYEIEQKITALRSDSRKLKSRIDAIAERQNRLADELEVLRQELLAAAGSDSEPKVNHQLLVKFKEMKTTIAALIRVRNERREVEYEMKRLKYCQIAMKEEFELARIPTVNTSGYEGRYTIGKIESEEDVEIEAESIKDRFCLGDDFLETNEVAYANEGRFYTLGLVREEFPVHAIFIQAPTDGVSDFTVFCSNTGEVQVEEANLGRFLLSYMKGRGYKSFDATRMDFNVERCLELAHSDLAELAPDAESHTTQAFERKFK